MNRCAPSLPRILSRAPATATRGHRRDGDDDLFACSSSLGADRVGRYALRAGELDLVIAGGYDTISEYVYGGFNSLRLVAEGPLRPFAKDRQGMKLAEGYGIVILERAVDAKTSQCEGAGDDPRLRRIR
jgi:hypothetical protein